MRGFILSFLLISSFPLSGANAHKENIDYVNMYLGSDIAVPGKHMAEYGGTVPEISAPFGMTQWCAATRKNFISSTMYRYRDTTLIGFQATHQPAIWMGDWCFMTIMPQAGELLTEEKDRRVPLDHAKEITSPYLYEVSYPSGGAEITTRMTATSRCAVFDICYPAGKTAYLYIEAGRENEGGGIRIIPENNEVWVYNKELQDRHLGPRLYNLCGYYVLRFSKPFKAYGTLTGHEKAPGGKEAVAQSVGGWVEFAHGSEVEIRCGSSFLSYGQAADNMAREIPADQDFDSVAASVKAQWNHYLDKVIIEGGTEDERALFYTSIFHTLQYPREFSEYGRYYSAFDDKVHEGISYTAYSLWDTFRAEAPWLEILAPERVDDMMQALVQMYEEGGWLPKWPNPTYTNIMIGTHADAVIASAYVNGFRGFDAQKAYEALRKDAFTPPAQDERFRWGDRHFWNGCPEGRSGLTNYIEKGFVAFDKTDEAVARTLEFALDDYCVAQMAKAMGKDDDYRVLIERSRNYRNLFDTETCFFRARMKDGSWGGTNQGFTEGANWTYRFCVMQDVPGMIDLMGGKESFMAYLDENFDKGHYRHDNEPGHHYAYLYDWCGHMDKTQARIRDILANSYYNTPVGLAGNDDCGQMSAWYIFSSMGFYPVTPASGEFALGIPLFEKVTLELPDGKTLVIKQKSPEVLPKTKVFLNGRQLPGPFVSREDLIRGGTLEFKK